jgi:hypothetical protein
LIEYLSLYINDLQQANRKGCWGGFDVRALKAYSGIA